jgi:hypothetical protein
MPRSRAGTALGAIAAALVAPACSGTVTTSPAPSPGGDTGDPPAPPSDNVIDVAIWPRLVRDGHTELPRASEAELCRRMSLDLVGVIPTPEEVASRCAGKSPTEMAAAFLAAPEFVARETAVWIQRLGEDGALVWGGYLVAADALIAKLALGEVGYDEFVARIIAHPTIAIARNPVGFSNAPDTEARDEVAIRVFRTFLGRAPHGDEALDYGRLFRPWRKSGYPFFHWHALLDPSRCVDPVLGTWTCTSERLGTRVTIELPDAEAALYEDLGEAVPEAIQRELEKPGRLLAGRAELWDQAADASLTRLLGWWRSSASEPDTDLPEVRAALAAWFRARPTRDIRELYATILSSLVYTTAAAPADPGERPPWAMGPSKAMSPEQWLDSVVRMTGVEIGWCDPHTDERPGATFFYPAEYVDPRAIPGSFYYGAATEMGGCAGGRARPREPGLRALTAHDKVADRACASSPPVPDGFDPAALTPGTLDPLVDHQFERLLTRAPTDAERTAIGEIASACAADPDCRIDAFAGQLCGALIRSAAFLYH